MVAWARHKYWNSILVLRDLQLSWSLTYWSNIRLYAILRRRAPFMLNAGGGIPGEKADLWKPCPCHLAPAVRGRVGDFGAARSVDSSSRAV